MPWSVEYDRGQEEMLMEEKPSEYPSSRAIVGLKLGMRMTRGPGV